MVSKIPYKGRLEYPLPGAHGVIFYLLIVVKLCIVTYTKEKHPAYIIIIGIQVKIGFRNKFWKYAFI